MGPLRGFLYGTVAAEILIVLAVSGQGSYGMWMIPATASLPSYILVEVLMKNVGAIRWTDLDALMLGTLFQWPLLGLTAGLVIQIRKTKGAEESNKSQENPEEKE